MTAASKTMNNIKRYMEQQAAKEALNTPRQGKNRGNGNNISNGNGNGNNG
jgi:hypothetical protein